MKKYILIILMIVLISLLIIGYSFYNYNQAQAFYKKINEDYASYYNKEVVGTTLISIINRTININEKNSIDKDENDIYYLDNNENSIKLYVKFSESDRIIPMEDIAEKETENFVQFYGTATFKCTTIEYHKKTNNVKSLYFEQI